MKTGFQLWQEHLQASFPDGYRGAEIKGIELVMLDSFTAGCIDSYYTKSGNSRPLDPKNHQILADCAKDLKVVVPELQGYPKQYFERLLTISEAILSALQSS